MKNTNQSDFLETELAAARAELSELRSAVRISERHIASLLEMFETQKQQLESQQSTLSRVERVLSEIVTGRVWRTLRAVANVAKKVAPGERVSWSGAQLIGKRNTYLLCDEPSPAAARARSGTITVRGWAVAPGGVDRVQIEVPGLPLIETIPSIARPDVQKLHPTLDATGKAGFLVRFDSQPLAKGRHPITLRALVNGGVVREARTFVDIDHDSGFSSDYERWIQEFERPESKIIQLKVDSFATQPTFSILMPVFNTKREELQAALDSVLEQSYPHWQLCICDDSSSDPAVREVLESYAARDARIKIHYAPQQGGISRASNAAWRLASGDFVAFLDHDDTLAAHALAYVCEAINQHPSSDFFYSDEDKIDSQGNRFDPFLKPDWSPDLLLSENYICHLLVLRKDLADALGGFNPHNDGSQDYDLVLRASRLSRGIRHIPKVLYHWRAGVASTASSIDHKTYALDAARRALASHCAATNPGSAIEPAAIAGRWRVRYPLAANTSVSIIIASGGKADILQTNLDSLFAKTSYSPYEVVIADNSKENSIEALVKRYQSAGRANLRYIDARQQPFNFSAINNAAARQCGAPVLLFLNDDTSVIEDGWLNAMLELAIRPNVGAVGAKLLYPNGAIQHAGVVMGLYDNCGHAFKGLNGAVGHYFDFSDVIRNVSAVTGACLMARAEVFWQVGGFDDAQFGVAFNDVDLCLKMRAADYRVLYTPHAVLYHHESHSKKTKDLIPHPAEVAAMKIKWSQVIAHDPYYNPNLSRLDEHYSLKKRG